jgi:hypothetical protein
MLAFLWPCSLDVRKIYKSLASGFKQTIALTQQNRDSASDSSQTLHTPNLAHLNSKVSLFKTVTKVGSMHVHDLMILLLETRKEEANRTCNIGHSTKIDKRTERQKK